MTKSSDTNAVSANRQQVDTTTVTAGRRGVDALGSFTVVEVMQPSLETDGSSGDAGEKQGEPPINERAAGMGHWAQHPALALWGRVLMRSGGLVLLLLLVAYLGHVSRDFERFGAVRSIDDLVERGLEAAERRGGRDPLASAQGVTPSSGETAHLSMVDQPTGSQNPEESAVQGAPAAPPGCPEEESASVGVLSDGRVILNEASASELTTLPGIGPSRAASILQLRERLGRFRKVTDLLRVKGIGYKSLQKLKERVVVDRPEEPAPEPSDKEEEQSASQAASLAAHAGL